MSDDTNFACGLERPRIAADLQPKAGRLVGMRRLLLTLFAALGVGVLLLT
jgi:hypothetical protein